MKEQNSNINYASYLNSQVKVQKNKQSNAKKIILTRKNTQVHNRSLTLSHLQNRQQNTSNENNIDQFCNKLILDSWTDDKNVQNSKTTKKAKTTEQNPELSNNTLRQSLIVKQKTFYTENRQIFNVNDKDTDQNDITERMFAYCEKQQIEGDDQKMVVLKLKDIQKFTKAIVIQKIFLEQANSQITRENKQLKNLVQKLRKNISNYQVILSQKQKQYNTKLFEIEQLLLFIKKDEEQRNYLGEQLLQNSKNIYIKSLISDMERIAHQTILSFDQNLYFQEKVPFEKTNKIQNSSITSQYLKKNENFCQKQQQKKRSNFEMNQLKQELKFVKIQNRHIFKQLELQKLLNKNLKQQIAVLNDQKQSENNFTYDQIEQKIQKTINSLEQQTNTEKEEYSYFLKSIDKKTKAKTHRIQRFKENDFSKAQMIQPNKKNSTRKSRDNVIKPEQFKHLVQKIMGEKTKLENKVRSISHSSINIEDNKTNNLKQNFKLQRRYEQGYQSIKQTKYKFKNRQLRTQIEQNRQKYIRNITQHLYSEIQDHSYIF